jgi:alkaline phosphatase D
VVLVSLDGFRYDYARKDGAKHLLALGAGGAIAPEGMIPSYPSLTFPNHYTLVTGLYPEHHGIVANSFYDPARKQRYSYTDPATDRDGSWYGGTPLWVLAEKQGMRTASFFWPGSEAEIDGGRPSYYLKFDNRFPDEKRIDQVVAWLRLPAEQRPHFITLYYSTVDHAGHQYGPDSPETAAAVQHVDELMGVLWAELTRLQLPIDLIVVSDHGMERVQGPWIDLSRYADLENFTTVGSLLYPNSEAAAEKAYQELKIKSDAFTVYRRKRVPAAMHYSSNAREGDPVVVANGPYAIRAHVDTQDLPPEVGAHGYDPRTIKSMRAFFLAVGPDIRSGTKLEPFENVNVYPLVANILGLNAPKVDGNLNVLSKILKDQPADTDEP